MLWLRSRWICQSRGSGTAAARRVRYAQLRTGASLVLSDWQIHDIIVMFLKDKDKNITEEKAEKEGRGRIEHSLSLLSETLKHYVRFAAQRVPL